MTPTNDDLRQSVSRAYASAVTTPKAGGCCGGPTPSSFLTNLAGYRPEDLATLPEGAVESAFGCGNPTAFADVRPGDTVLDLGSGAGIDLILAARKVGPTGRVIGVDMTDEMLAKARETTAGLPNVELRKGIIEELPVESASVDFVISNCVINLSPEKLRVFREIARVLKPGGRMSVSDVVAESLPDWLRENEAFRAACVAGAISEAEYLAGLTAAGLRDVRVTERLVYDADQLTTFLATDTLASNALGCCGGTLPHSLLRPLVETVAGKVWSARIEARKPLA